MLVCRSLFGKSVAHNLPATIHHLAALPRAAWLLANKCWDLGCSSAMGRVALISLGNVANICEP